jgi:hypothetical protein
MRVKEQLAIYTKALSAEEQFRSEVNASIDARVVVINDLIDGTKKLHALVNGSDSELDTEDETDSEPEVTSRGEAPKKKKSKKKAAPAASKKASKKTASKKAKPAKVFTKATSVPKVSKKSSGIPRLEDAIQLAMGNKELTAPEIHLELKARHWIPDSKDPLGYIRYALSANPAIFRRREGVRGKYHLDSANPYSTGKHKVPIEGHVNPKGKKKNKDKGSSPTSSKAVVEAHFSASTPVPAPEVDSDNGEREDPSAVVSELLRDAGEKAFGRQAPPLGDS